MKRLVCFMVAAAMLLGLAACVLALPQPYPQRSRTNLPPPLRPAQTKRHSPATAPKPQLPRKYRTTISFGT